MTLSSLILFDVNKYDLKDSAKEGLEQVIEITLTLEERTALHKSAAAVKELTDIIGV